MDLEISFGRLKDLYNICQKSIDWSGFYSLNETLEKSVCAEFDYVMNWNTKNIYVPGTLKSLDFASCTRNIIESGIEPITYFFDQLEAGVIEENDSPIELSQQEIAVRLEKIYSGQDSVSLTEEQAYDYTLLCKSIQKIGEEWQALESEQKVAELIRYCKCSGETPVIIDSVFDSNYYLTQNPDVFKSGMNPIVHFLHHGMAEKRLSWPSEANVENAHHGDFSETNLSVMSAQESVDLVSYDEFKQTLSEDSYKSSILFNPEYVKKALGRDSITFKEWFDEFVEKPVSPGPIWAHFAQFSGNSNEERVHNFIQLSKALSQLHFESEHSCLVFLCLLRDGNSLPETTNRLNAFIKGEKKRQFSFFFDRNYVEKIAETKFSDQFEAFNYWYQHREALGSCTPVFNDDFYKTKYQDIAEHYWPFFHYIAFGRFEGRIPHYGIDKCYFVPQFQKNRACVISAEMHIDGSLRRVFPFLDVLSRKALCAFDGKALDEFDISEVKILSEISPLFDDYNSLMYFSHVIDVRSIIFEGEKFDLGSLTLPIESESRFSYLFDHETAIEQVGELESSSFIAVFKQWLNQFSEKDTSPTPVFDPAYYRKKNRDLLNLSGNAFSHYVFHGQYEGRAPHPFIDPLWVKNTYGISGYSLLDETIYASTPRKPSQAIAPLSNMGPGFGELYELCKDTLNSDSFSFADNSKLQLALKTVNQIEPLIKVWEPSRVFTTMPYNIDSYMFIRDLPELVGTADILIFRDAINFGGADVVLGEVYRALKYSQKDKSIKVISLGSVDYDVLPERGIDSSDVVDLSAVLNGANEFNVNQVVYDIIQGSGCSSLLNLNCGALWACIEDYGKILSKTCDLYGYFFCDDKDEFGNVTGYPAKYLASTARYLKKIYFDSEYLLSCISRRGVIGNSLTNKIVVLPTPLRHSGFSEKSVKASGVIAWAGRFDRQKRPDILIEVAKRMPEYQFKVWGKAVLDRTPYQWDSAENIQLMGLYDSEQDLLNEGCSLLLYTSEWDGVPTLLLKMHELGLPVIASDVGGVSEVIPEDCLISEVDNIDLYVDAITAFYSTYDKRVARYQTFVDDLCSVRSTEEFEKGLVV